jgi:head-tail adaptor
MSSVAVGKRRYLVTLAAITNGADGDGGSTEVVTPLVPPTRRAEIKPATARDLERLTAGTVISTETLLVTMPFHPLVTTKTRVAWTDLVGRAHTANVTGVNNPDGRCRELVLVAVEVVA